MSYSWGAAHLGDGSADDADTLPLPVASSVRGRDRPSARVRVQLKPPRPTVVTAAGRSGWPLRLMWWRARVDGRRCR
jgi:hypothetical protein